MRSADQKGSRSISGGSNMVMPSLNPGTMTFGELFVMLLNPVKVHQLLHLVLIIVLAMLTLLMLLVTSFIVS